MAPKRAASASGSIPGKRRKVPANETKKKQEQTTLDVWRESASVSPQKKTGTPSKLRDVESLVSSSQYTLDEVKSDELAALELAASEGIDVETIRRLEQTWKKRVRGSSSSKQLPEVIDVDAFSEDAEKKLHRNSSPFGTSATMKVIHRGHSRTPPIMASSSTDSHAFFPNTRSAHVDISAYPDLAVDPLVFSCLNPPWGEGIPTPYSFLTHTLCCLSATRSRILILNILTNTIRLIIRHDQQSLLDALYLLSNTLAPPYVPIELGLGSSIISKAIQHVSGLTPIALRRLYTKSGDPGDVAFEAKSNIRTLIPHPPLTIKGVYNSLLKICNSRGGGAGKQKQAIVEKLLVAAKGEEVRFLVRTMAQHTRVGAVRASILTALARALVLTRPPTQHGFNGSQYYAEEDLVRRVNVAIRKGKQKNNEDPARTEIQQKYSDAEAMLKRVYVQHPNYDHIVKAILDVGLECLSENVVLSIGTPLRPTLGSPMRSLEEVYDRLEDLPFTAEFKYDGQRAQIHSERREDGSLLVKIFSRHLEDMTDKYPDVIALVEAIYEVNADLKAFIMDSEIVAVDPRDGAIKTFQELSNRARKEVSIEEVKITVCVYAFDLMFHNGNSLLEEPFRTRRQRLRGHFPPITPSVASAARFAHVEYCESTEGKESVEEFWQKSVESRAEGLMIKVLDSGEVAEEDTGVNKSKGRRKPLLATYEPDKRTSAWLKLKKDYVTGLGDSLDLVPIGAWHGNGRKAAWWSPILLAVWDEHENQFVGVCKCMSGFTDEFYKALNERYPENSENCSRTPLWNVNTGGRSPEVYFKPQEVWEIRGADITLSPVYMAALGLVSPARGLSLRFPRFIRLRGDKGTIDASTPEFLASLWRKQENKGSSGQGIDDGELVDISPEASEVEEDEYE